MTITGQDKQGVHPEGRREKPLNLRGQDKIRENIWKIERSFMMKADRMQTVIR
jgi:hypothetical protein